MHLNNEVLGKDFYLKGEWVGLIQLLKKPAVVQAKENISILLTPIRLLTDEASLYTMANK